MTKNPEDEKKSSPPFPAESKQLWEVKTTLPASEQDDGRPILFRHNHGLKGLTCIMGGKIDNIYDVAKEIDVILTAVTR